MRLALWLTLLAAVAAPSATAAEPSNTSGGTLALRSVDGVVTLTLKGAVIGRLGSGTLAVQIPAERACEDLSIWGEEKLAEERKVTEDGDHIWVCRYSGKGIRFRLAGERFMRFRPARNLMLSAVGRGAVTLNGTETTDGTFALNGGEEQPVPKEPRRFAIAPPSDQE